MITNKFSEMVLSETDLVDQVMQGRSIMDFDRCLVDYNLDLETAALILDKVPALVAYDAMSRSTLTQVQFDYRCQQEWFMPQNYRDLDIAEHVLGLCNTDAQLQRVGQELLLYQERNLFNLLRYLKFLVDIMQENKLIWGVGRGSSTASYVLYKLGVHKIDSLRYDLNPQEFLR